MNRIWDEAVARSPYLFDGQMVACTGLEWQEQEWQGQELVLSWARATYRYRALRRIRRASGWLPSSLVVTILQPTDGGELWWDEDRYPLPLPVAGSCLVSRPNRRRRVIPAALRSRLPKAGLRCPTGSPESGGPVGPLGRVEGFDLQVG